MITNAELIEMLGGIEAVDAHIRKLAEPVAIKKNMTVDELLNDVCYADVPGFETTYARAYRLAYLDGVRRGMAETISQIKNHTDPQIFDSYQTGKRLTD